jgi:hypothetical protein
VDPTARLVIEHNIRQYRNLLNIEIDAALRESIAKLLAEEEAMLTSLSEEERKEAP